MDDIAKRKTMARHFVETLGVKAVFNLMENTGHIIDDHKTPLQGRLNTANVICDLLLACVDHYQQKAAYIAADAAEWAGIKRGCRSYSDDDVSNSGVSWWVFPDSVSDEDILAKLEKNNIETTGYQGGPGRRYAHPATIWRQGSRAIVKIQSGLDV